MTVMLYKKKPVTISAVQWVGDNLEECKKFLGNSFIKHKAERRPNGRSDIYIQTLEGQHIASKGDFLIKGVQGEFYPCKPDIFEATYQLLYP